MQIRERRKEKRLTQQQLANLVGVTPGAIWQWEHGMSAPSSKRLPDVASALGCTVDDLLSTDDGGGMRHGAPGLVRDVRDLMEER